MAFIPVPNVVLVEMVYRQLDEVTENTLYFQGNANWTIEDMSDLAESMKAWWIDNLEFVVNQGVALTAVRVTDLSTQFSPGIEDVNGLPNSGLAPSPAMPNNVTVTTTFLTGLRGRSYRGRNYFIGLSEAQVVGNIVTAELQTAVLAAYNDLPTYAIANGAAHVVVSRYSAKQPRVTGVATLVTGYKMEPTIDSQRRRLPGRGQ